MKRKYLQRVKSFIAITTMQCHVDAQRNFRSRCRRRDCSGIVVSKLAWQVLRCIFFTQDMHSLHSKHTGLDRCKQITLPLCIGGVWGGGRGGHCPPRSEPIDFVRSMNTKIFSHCLILFALSYFNEYVKASLFVIHVKK